MQGVGLVPLRLIARHTAPKVMAICPTARVCCGKNFPGSPTVRNTEEGTPSRRWRGIPGFQALARSMIILRPRMKAKVHHLVTRWDETFSGASSDHPINCDTLGYKKSKHRDRERKKRAIDSFRADYTSDSLKTTVVTSHYFQFKICVMAMSQLPMYLFKTL